jgi:hypothetical protein
MAGTGGRRRGLPPIRPASLAVNFMAAPGWPRPGEAPGESFTDIALDLVAGALRAVAGHHDDPPPRGADP